MICSGHKKLFCEISKLSKFNGFLGYKTNTDASILVYNYRSERTGFNMYAEYTQLQLTFLALIPCFFQDEFINIKGNSLLTLNNL